MDIDLHEIKRRYPDVDWSVEDLKGEKGKEVRSIIGKKGSYYKAIAIPPHNYFLLNKKRWDYAVAAEIYRMLEEKN